MEDMTMFDTTPVITEIAKLITAGLAERQLLAVVSRRYPDLSPAELSQALQVATTAAERHAVVAASRQH
jgi:hypothetical protein